MSVNTRIVHADIHARVEYNTSIEIEVSGQATEEEIWQALDDAAQQAVAEYLQTYQGLQPEITITRQDEEEEHEREAEEAFAYGYQVEVSTQQMLYQTITVRSACPLTEEQIIGQAVEKAQKGVWLRGDIDQSLDIVDSIDHVTVQAEKE